MKSKEEIFNEYSWKELGHISPSKNFCLQAMGEYGKQLAIGFGNYIIKNNWIRWSNHWEKDSSSSDTISKSTEQLFELYLENLKSITE